MTRHSKKAPHPKIVAGLRISTHRRTKAENKLVTRLTVDTNGANKIVAHRFDRAVRDFEFAVQSGVPPSGRFVPLILGFEFSLDPFDFAQGRLSIAYRWKLEGRAPSRPHDIVGRFCETPLCGSQCARLAASSTSLPAVASAKVGDLDNPITLAL